MEPEWTKSISSETVCNFFYFFFVVYAVIAVLGLFSFGSLFFLGLPKSLLVATGGQILLTMSLALATALFHYLVCSRALLSGGR